MNRLHLIYGDYEIKNIHPKIQKILTVIDEHSSPIHKLSTALKFKKDIAETFSVDTATSTGTAFLDKKQVIKIGYLTRRPPDKKYRVPSLIYSVDTLDCSDWNSSFVVMIQPRVKMVDGDDDKEVKIAESWFKNIAKTTDIRPDNIGYYRRQYKLIDW